MRERSPQGGREGYGACGHEEGSVSPFMTEQELIAKAKAGDTDAFAQLVEQNQNRIYSLALRMVGSPEDAADLAQEAFLSAWRGLEKFQGEAAFSTWLYRLTSNACIDFLRKEKRKRAAVSVLWVDDTEEGATLDLPDYDADPHRQLEREEVRATIARGMAELSPEHRKVLSLREISGLSYAEIAHILGLEEGTVKSRIARARLALRKKLLEYGNFSPGDTSEEKEKEKPRQSPTKRVFRGEEPQRSE